MHIQTPIRWSVLFCLAAPLCAQGVRPPQPASPQATPPSQPASATLPPVAPTENTASNQTSQTPPGRPKITFKDDQLSVVADNSSLNQILHEVSQLTGIVITGGVAEERVFGTYGPAPASQVLNQLLDGTSSNMIFIGSASGKAPQLILTSRNGSPTPPNPNSMHFEDNDNDSDDQQSGIADTPPPPPTSVPSQPATPPPASNTPAAAPASTQQSPNGTRTPQQIYDELMRLRRQQQSNQPQ